MSGRATSSYCRKILRDALVFVAVVLTVPLWLPARVSRLLGSSDDLFATCSQIVGVFPGLAGVLLRRGFYWMCLEFFGRNCSIGCGTWFSHPQTSIGWGVYIGGRCMIGTCDIANDVLIGSNVDILSGRHQHRADDPALPRRLQGGTFSKVRIGRNAWIGNSAVVMADVGDDCVIGAGSVVVKPIPAGSVAVGNPAVVKKSREQPTQYASPDMDNASA